MIYCDLKHKAHEGPSLQQHHHLATVFTHLVQRDIITMATAAAKIWKHDHEHQPAPENTEEIRCALY